MAQNVVLLDPLALSSITTGNERSERPAAHLAYPDIPGLVWQSNGNGSLWVRGQLPAGSLVDFISLVSANAQSGTTIRVRLGTSQAHVDGSSAPYDSTALAFISPSITSADGFYHSHLALGSTVTATWWRIDIGGHTGDFQASALIIGKRLQFGRFYDRTFEFGVEDLGAIDIGRFGVATVEDGITMRTLGFRLSRMTVAEYQAQVRPLLQQKGKRGVVWCCFDPEAGIYRQANTYLGWLKQLPTAQGQQKPGLLGADFQMLSII